MNTAYVSEIYASVQGEGPYAGERQIFLRMAGCPLRCNYCDTPGSLVAAGHRRMSVDEVVKEILKVRGKKPIHTVSATGGEPLVYAPFLKLVFERLRKKKFRIYLETAGAHPDALARVVKLCDVIAMDIKLPSATRQVFWKEHARFLRVGGKKIFVKIILEKGSLPSEIVKAVSILKVLKHPPLLVLQPATPIPPRIKAPSVEQVADAYAFAAALLPAVLVMGQQHKVWGVR